MTEESMEVNIHAINRSNRRCGGRKIGDFILYQKALQMSDCTKSSIPVNWFPGQPVIQSPPKTYPLLQERLTSIEQNNSGMNWYLSFQDPKEQCTDLN